LCYVIKRDGAKVVIDEVSLGYLKGSTVEYHEELIQSAFRISFNPNAEKGCSCGLSFTLLRPIWMQLILVPAE